MRFFLEFLLAYFLRFVLWFRYKVTVKGLDKLNPEYLNRKGGVLFLPNHTSVFVDPAVITLAVWPKFRMRHMIVEYMYYMPVIHSVMSFLNALPVPNFETSNNSLKRRKIENMIQTVVNDLKDGKNFLIYPSGRLKHTAYEAIEGASAVHQIIQETPEANIVLVRLKGLWGSSLSRAITGKTPLLFPTLKKLAKFLFLNFLFFSPRRQIIIEFEPAPADFPYKGSRLEMNKYLEKWYNKPDGLTPQVGESPGDSLVLVPYSIWSNKVPEIQKVEQRIDDTAFQITDIPKDIQKRVTNKIAELVESPPAAITFNMDLNADLGMDSLDIAEMIAFLHDEFEVENANVEDLTTVGKAMALAAKLIEGHGGKEEDQEMDISRWNKSQSSSKHQVEIAPGETIPEVFLNNCARMGNAIACGDMRSGILTYSELKLRVILLAEYLKHKPGQYVGIMLPSSVAAIVTILATQLAGKVPVMVNWTVGTRHLQTIAQLTNVQTVLSAWSFIERLQNVELDGIEDKMLLLEDVRREIGIISKIKAFAISKCSTKCILKWFNLQSLSKDSPAVLLFTSGTESLPKGVPLTSNNILSNQRASLQGVKIYNDDVIFSILPPFHSFGFTVSGLIGILSGVKTAYSPDPTDGVRMAVAFERWGATIMCGAPTFIKALVKSAQPGQLKTMRLCVSGAEKTPPELIAVLDQLGKADSLIEGYGITECAPVLTLNNSTRTHRGVGAPLPGIELCIVDLEGHHLLAEGQQGLILARGPNIFSGYLNPGISSPFLTVDGKQWYITGDLGYLDEEGRLTISGRLKRFIKIGAEMVSLASIEDVLMEMAVKKGLTSFSDEGPTLAICAKEVPGEKPKIFLFSKFLIPVEDVNKLLKDSGFSNLVKVTSVTKIEELPIMGSGKINYRKLEENLKNSV